MKFHGFPGHDPQGCLNAEAATMYAPSSNPNDPNSTRPTGRSALLNTILGTVGLILAVVILIHEGMESEADRVRSSKSASLAVFHWPDRPVFTISWSPDGRRLAASGFGPSIRIWERDSGRSMTLENATDQPRFVLGWSSDCEQLIVGGMDTPIEFWNFDRASAIPEIHVPSEDRSKLAVSLAKSTRGRALRLWGTADRRLRLFLPDCQGANTLAFSPDGRFMASGAGDGTLQLWDLASGELRRSLATDSRGVNSVAFSPDGSQVISSGGGPIRLWDVATGQETAKLGEDSNGSATVAFSPDGRRIAGATWDGSIRIWDLATRREQARFEGHFGQVLTLAWSPDGKTIASGGYDSTVRLWNVAGSTEAARVD